MKHLIKVLRSDWLILSMLASLAGFAGYLHLVSTVQDKSLLVFVMVSMFVLIALYVITMVLLEAWFTRQRHE